MVFGEGQQSSNKNTEKCRGMYGRWKNGRIKGNPNVSYRENGRMKGKKPLHGRNTAEKQRTPTHHRGTTDVCRGKSVELLIRDAEAAGSNPVASSGLKHRESLILLGFPSFFVFKSALFFENS